MTTEILSPGVQYGHHTHLAIKALLAKGAQRGPRALEQQGIEHAGVHLEPRIEAVWQGKDQVMVGHRQPARRWRSAHIAEALRWRRGQWRSRQA